MLPSLLVSVVLGRVAHAEELAFECVTLTSALDARPYTEAYPDSVLEDAYDTLYAYVDDTCTPEDCSTGSISCSRIVDCTTAAGDLVNWSLESEWDSFGSYAFTATIEVVPAADRALGWTRADATRYVSGTEFVVGYSYETSVSYDGHWGVDGWPEDGVLEARHADLEDSAGYDMHYASWDDGTCDWRVSVMEEFGDSNSTVWVTPHEVDVDWWLWGPDCESAVSARAELDGVYVGRVDDETWEAWPYPDADLDGASSEDDCDDANPAVNLCAAEITNDGIDNNCDGVAEVDADGDGGISVDTLGDDCLDSDATVYVGAPEVPYDGIDQNCDGSDLVDVDRDRYVAVEAGGDDCLDTDRHTRPGAYETPYDGIDQDCDGADLVDVDGDGFVATEAAGDDCLDSDPRAHPGAPEVAGDGIDQDCNGRDAPGVRGPGFRLDRTPYILVDGNPPESSTPVVESGCGSGRSMVPIVWVPLWMSRRRRSSLRVPPR